jgi:outer membrane lipoprotein SlyB
MGLIQLHKDDWSYRIYTTEATGAGAVAGAALGQRAGQAMGRAQSIEWFVQLESGREISVIQGDPIFSTGQRVRVISGGGSTRLAPA